MSIPLRTFPTLKGVFSEPKKSNRRDFIRENKLSLKEKEATKKKTVQDQSRPKWMPREVEQIKTNPRSATKTREEQKLRCKMGRCGTCGSQPSIDGNTLVFRDCGIQTEDIIDETYLTNALRRCTISRSSTSVGNEDSVQQINKSGTKDNSQEIVNCRKMNDLVERDELILGKSKCFTSQTKEQKNSKYTDNSIRLDEEKDDDILYHFENLDYELDTDGHISDEGAQLSARSRQTLLSNVTNESRMTTKSKRRAAHKLGSRENVCLPLYLQREKREKEEKAQNALKIDPDCPPGHKLLSESQRLDALANAKKRFDSLVNELNHMPMTTQTLRIRNRRAVIDKELSEVETIIRVYSKSRVYEKF